LNTSTFLSFCNPALVQAHGIITEILASEAVIAVYHLPESNKITLMKAEAWQENNLADAVLAKELSFFLAPFQGQKKSFCLTPNLTVSFELPEKNVELPLSDGLELYQDLAEKQSHIQLVSRTIQYIQEKNLGKIVISRSQTVPSGTDKVDVVASFLSLLLTYPVSFSSLIKLPDGTIWLGATPEILATMDKKKNVLIMSLAGTKTNQSDVWGEKETHEQALVTKYILSQAEGYLKNLNVTEPETLQTGALSHILAKISGKITKQDDFARLVSVLHPTPAIAGFPAKEALEYISKNEKYDRAFYSGFLGPINQDYEHNLFVNLRTAAITPKTMTFYAGGGINAQSVPESEWNETQAKMNVVAKALVFRD